MRKDAKRCKILRGLFNVQLPCRHNKNICVVMAINEKLKQLGPEVGRPIIIYEIGVALVVAGFNQHEIVNGPFRREKQGFIELLPSNALRLLSSLCLQEQSTLISV